MQLQHSTGGNTNTVGFMKDDLTSSPSVDVSSATLTQNNAGTFRYISGIPYYNSGSPTLDSLLVLKLIILLDNVIQIKMILLKLMMVLTKKEHLQTP